MIIFEQKAWSVIGKALSLLAIVTPAIIALFVFFHEDYEIEAVGKYYPLTVPTQEFNLSENVSEFQKDLKRLSSVIEIRIENIGEDAINKLSAEILMLGGFFAINGGDPIRFGKEVQIAESLLPGKSVHLKTWTVLSMEKHYEDDIKIMHEKGIVEVNFSREIDGVLVWVDDHWSWMILFLYFLVATHIFTFAIGERSGKKQK